MALQSDDLHHFDIDTYLRLVGVDPEAFERTELVAGVVLDVSPESWLHAETVRIVDGLLAQRFPGRSRRNGSVLFPPASLWAPDVYVLRPDVAIEQYPVGANLEVVVEVAVSTVARDLGFKAQVYAAAGIERYDVIEPLDGCYRVTTHLSPVDGQYRYIKSEEVTELSF